MWSGLGACGEGSDERDRLIARYSEPGRRYHTVQHLSECLATFESAAHLAQRVAEVEAGLWFHDAVYELRRADNEEQSARLALDVLSKASVSSEVASRVAALVLATKHTAVPQAPDEQLLVDIDLSILGASKSRFAEYERQFREEYTFVPEAVFREKRQAILRAFIARPSIYGTEYFRGLLEHQARVNLAASTGDAA
jgi:predicted metal-dependent HD superfamily phosphohydrolase